MSQTFGTVAWIPPPRRRKRSATIARSIRREPNGGKLRVTAGAAPRYLTTRILLGAAGAVPIRCDSVTP
jgi:hypothetical protein